jgi:hypothetical protein
MEKEIWVNMKYPYENYMISSYGFVKNIKNNCILSLNDNKIGYIRINLSNGKGKKYLLYRLVAEYFIDNFDVKYKINHIDGNTFNNNVSNLELCTIKENNNRKIFKALRKKFALSIYDKINTNNDFVDIVGRWYNSPIELTELSFEITTKPDKLGNKKTINLVLFRRNFNGQDFDKEFKYYPNKYYQNIINSCVKSMMRDMSIDKILED